MKVSLSTYLNRSILIGLSSAVQASNSPSHQRRLVPRSLHLQMPYVYKVKIYTNEPESEYLSRATEVPIGDYRVVQVARHACIH